MAKIKSPFFVFAISVGVMIIFIRREKISDRNLILRLEIFSCKVYFLRYGLYKAGT